MEDEQFVDLTFPTNGTDQSMEFELQPDQSTPFAVNVRGYEPSTMRLRGGARAGLAKYVPAQLPSGNNVIQLLDYIVDPQGDALLTSDDNFGGTAPGVYILDPSSNNGGPGGGFGIVTGDVILSGGEVVGGITPLPFVTGLGNRNPGRYILNGGSGIAPNRTFYTSPPPPPHPPGMLKYMGGTASSLAGSGSGTWVVGPQPLVVSIIAGDLIVVSLQITGSPNATDQLMSVGTIAYSDTFSDGYTQLGQTFFPLYFGASPITATANYVSTAIAVANGSGTANGSVSVPITFAGANPNVGWFMLATWNVFRNWTGYGGFQQNSGMAGAPSIGISGQTKDFLAVIAAGSFGSQAPSGYVNGQELSYYTGVNGVTVTGTAQPIGGGYATGWSLMGLDIQG